MKLNLGQDFEAFVLWRGQSCKNVPTVPTSWCYFFWPVLIFGKSTQKTGKNTRKQAKTRENRRKTGAFLVLIFWGEKLVGANFYAFCNYGMEWTTLQCKECFKFIFFRGETEIFSENRPQNEMPLVSPTGKDSPTGGPRHRSDEHEHQLYHCPVTLFSTLPLPWS